MRDHFGIGLAGEFRTLGDQRFAQFAEVLDDAVMHDRDLIGRVRMGIAFGRLAVGRPSGMADAGVAAERLFDEQGLERVQFAHGAPARQHAMIERGDAG